MREILCLRFALKYCKANNHLQTKQKTERDETRLQDGHNFGGLQGVHYTTLFFNVYLIFSIKNLLDRYI